MPYTAPGCAGATEPIGALGAADADARHPHPGGRHVEGQGWAQLAHRHLDRLEPGVGDQKGVGQPAGQGLEEPVRPLAHHLGRRLGQGAVVDGVGQGVDCAGPPPCRPRPRCRGRTVGPARAPRAARRARPPRAGPGSRSGPPRDPLGHGSAERRGGPSRVARSSRPGSPMACPQTCSMSATACGWLWRRLDHTR